MATDLPDWVAKAASGAASKRLSRKARPNVSTMPAEGSQAISQRLKQMTAAESHNVFRPDIYRVSNGYLN